MSVLVKDMDMPKCCIECSCCRHDNWNGETAHQCNVSLITFSAEDENWIYDQRPNWCPLVEIPTSHGRLIDADKFAETLKEVSIRQGYDKLFSDNILSVGDVFDAIAADLKGEGLDKYKLAPTVIEAEER